MKSILVTGAAQGLGLEIAKKGLKKGYQVFALSRHMSQDLEDLQNKRCFVYECDVTDLNKLQECKKDIQRHTDALDIVFNNAGVWADSKRLLLEDPEFDFSLMTQQFEINAAGPIKVVRTFIDMVKKSKCKCIINISSEAGSIENALRVCEYGYCMSKAALNMGTKILQNAFPEIKFYAIHPGWMKTPQGYAGATKECSPQQEPSDTAEKLFSIAENKTYNYIFGDFEGNKMPW